MSVIEMIIIYCKKGQFIYKIELKISLQIKDDVLLLLWNVLKE